MLTPIIQTPKGNTKVQTFCLFLLGWKGGAQRIVDHLFASPENGARFEAAICTVCESAAIPASHCVSKCESSESLAAAMYELASDGLEDKIAISSS